MQIITYLRGEVDNCRVGNVLGEEPCGGGHVGGHVGGRLFLRQDKERLQEGKGGAGLGGDVQERHGVLVEHIVGDRAVRHHSLLDPAQTRRAPSVSPSALQFHLPYAVLHRPPLNC